jgi:carbamoylphosphate synthase small subunit
MTGYQEIYTDQSYYRQLLSYYFTSGYVVKLETEEESDGVKSVEWFCIDAITIHD